VRSTQQLLLADFASNRPQMHEVPKGKGATKTVSGCLRHSTSPFGTISPSCACYSSLSTSSGIWSTFLIPRTPFTFSSISSIMLWLSFRNIFAFSRPCPMRWP
jgi:hypothetical protein